MPITVSNTAAITAAVQAMLNSQKTALDVTINAARDAAKTVKSIQRGTALSITAGVQDITIAAVDVSKSVLVMSAASNTSAYTSWDIISAGEILNSTTVRLNRPNVNVGTAGRVSWQVVEYF